MDPFPLFPLQTTVVVEVLPDHNSKLIIPDGKQKRNVAACKVLAVGPGAYSNDGKLIPLDVKPGDLIIVIAGYISKIDYGVRGHLIARGVDEKYLDEVGIMQYENVLGKLPPLPETKSE